MISKVGGAKNGVAKNVKVIAVAILGQIIERDLDALRIVFDDFRT